MQACCRIVEAAQIFRSGRYSRKHFPSIMLAVVLLFGGTGVSRSNGRIGGAETVINIVQGDLVSGSSFPVAQGDAVYRDEGVRTSTDSKARILLEDQTNLTIGPSSTVKLDR